MNKTEALAELQKWKAIYDQCEAVSKPLRELFGDLSDEMPLYKAIWAGFDFATTQLTERLYPDRDEYGQCFLGFFAWDCDMGNTPKQVTKNGETRILRTLDDVLWIMGY